MLSLTVRDVLWMLLVGWLAAAWQLDAQVKALEFSDERDKASLFQADNAVLERENAMHRARLQQLERHVADVDWAENVSRR